MRFPSIRRWGVFLGVCWTFALTPMTPTVRAKSNVPRSEVGEDWGLVKQYIRLSWPAPLRADRYRTEREWVERLLEEVAERATKGRDSTALTQAMEVAVRKFEEHLDEHVADLTPDQYVEARRFLRRLKLTMTVPPQRGEKKLPRKELHR